LPFNPAKLLLDPYARAISGTVSFGPEVCGYAADDPDAPSTLDSAGHVPRSLVIDDTYRWSNGARPRRSYADTTIYEVDVKGFTMRHPGEPEELRGTYAGLGHEAAISHLLDLGVTAVELLPVHERVPEAFLPQRGLTNYWGYNTTASRRTGDTPPQCGPGGPGGRSASSRLTWRTAIDTYEPARPATAAPLPRRRRDRQPPLGHPYFSPPNKSGLPSLHHSRRPCPGQVAP
jgi:hypothetical protein